MSLETLYTSWQNGAPLDKHIRWSLYKKVSQVLFFLYYKMLGIELGTELGGDWRRYFNMEKNFKEKCILLSYFLYVTLASAPWAAKSMTYP